ALFPHRPQPAPAASSFRGLSTRAERSSDGKVAPRPASKNLQDSGNSLRSRGHRTTSTKAAIEMAFGVAAQAKPLWETEGADAAIAGLIQRLIDQRAPRKAMVDLKKQPLHTTKAKE
ncbi:hypothetical protein, partial [Roseovarius sp. A-2]|uniref:hypothetical protein n=1 Tax=Roseovarius sp. A-2 TaxID=1570360 RepID=UPI001C393DA8